MSDEGALVFSGVTFHREGECEIIFWQRKYIGCARGNGLFGEKFKSFEDEFEIICQNCFSFPSISPLALRWGVGRLHHVINRVKWSPIYQDSISERTRNIHLDILVEECLPAQPSQPQPLFILGNWICEKGLTTINFTLSSCYAINLITKTIRTTIHVVSTNSSSYNVEMGSGRERTSETFMYGSHAYAISRIYIHPLHLLIPSTLDENGDDVCSLI